MLDLEGNNLTNDEVSPLIAAVKKNTNLRVFDISENDLTEGGRVEMVKAVFDTESLNAIAESNHRCRLHVSKEEYRSSVGGV